MSGRASGKRPLAKVRLDGQVGRSRYAEESQAVTPGIILHLHFLICEEVILQPFVRKRHHDHHRYRAI